MSTISSSAFAAEGSIFGGPLGGTDIRAAYLPKSGCYGSVVAGVARATSFKDQNGNTSNSTARFTTDAAAAGILCVYPWQPWGWTIASGVQLNYQLGTESLNGRAQEAGSMGDPYVELLAASHAFGRLFGEQPSPAGGANLPYGLSAKLSYSMILPLGYYSSQALFTPGHNDVFFIPNFAVTYLFGPNFLGDGLEVSIRDFMDFASVNPTTHYSTGFVNDVDFAITERTRAWQYSLAGYYAQQYVNDSINGVVVQPDGKRLKNFYLGPVLAYDIPSLNATLKIKAYIPLTVENGLNSIRGYMSVNFKL